MAWVEALEKKAEEIATNAVVASVGTEHLLAALVDTISEAPGGLPERMRPFVDGLQERWTPLLQVLSPRRKRDPGNKVGVPSGSPAQQQPAARDAEEDEEEMMEWDEEAHSLLDSALRRFNTEEGVATALLEAMNNEGRMPDVAPESSFSAGTRVEAIVPVPEYFVKVGDRGVVVGPHPTKREKLKILWDGRTTALTAFTDELRKLTPTDDASPPNKPLEEEQPEGAAEELKKRPSDPSSLNLRLPAGALKGSAGANGKEEQGEKQEVEQEGDLSPFSSALLSARKGATTEEVETKFPPAADARRAAEALLNKGVAAKVNFRCRPKATAESMEERYRTPRCSLNGF